MNLLDGIRSVIYKTDVAKAVKQSTIKLVENNFRYAARMFCANNYGVNPHDLHNVLTKADQIFVKNERAKIEAKINEVAKTSAKLHSKQSLEMPSDETFKTDYIEAQKGKKDLTLFSGTLERGASRYNDIQDFIELYSLMSEAQPGDYITPKHPLWTSGDAEINRFIYGPGKSSDGDKTIQWEIKIGKGAPTPMFAEGNQSYVFRETSILINSKYTDDVGNIYVTAQIGGPGYNPSSETSRQEFTGRDLDQEGASFTTPEYENETYKFMQNNLLKPTFTDLEASSITIKEVVNNPESYLKGEIIEYILSNFGDLSKQSVYMGLRSYVIGETDGTKSITISENGDRYYFADVTNVKKWNTTSLNRIANEDPTGTSLFDKYQGKTVSAKEFWKGEALVGSAGNVEIEFRDGGGTYYSDEQNKIYFDTKSKFISNNLEFLFALNHEFQHALQGTNRTAKGFALGLDIPKELVEQVKKEYPRSFRKATSEDQEKRIANEIIYQLSGEKEADQHAIEEDYYPFIVAVKDDHYVIFTPSGAGPYSVGFARTNKLDEGKEKPIDLKLGGKKVPLKRNPNKDLIESTNLKYFKKKGKKLRLDPDLQGFIIEANNLDMLDEWVSKSIKNGSLTKQKLMKWFKNGKKIETTTDMKQVIEQALVYVPKAEREEAVKKSCARTFQALRIDVNSEFEVLYAFLEKLPKVLAPNGRVAILTFHSGEDRLVKRSFKELEKAGIYKEASKDVIRPTAEECVRNSRAKSTKMRWAIRA